MNIQLLQAIKNGQLALFLGAGASHGCLKNNKQPVPGSGDLAKTIATAAGLAYEDEPLDAVYEAARELLGARLNTILEENFKHVTPSTEYDRLAKFVWRRIYTLNIDDGLDKSLTRHSPQDVNRLLASDPVIDRDPFFNKVEYIKLNGTIDRLHDGIIFSPSEYAQATVKHLPWYSQCASDFSGLPVLFIGTQLNEPLLKFHIERYQSLNQTPQGVSYLIARSATEIQRTALKRYKIEFIPGTLSDFVAWLEMSLPTPPTPDEIAKQNIPQLKFLLEGTSSKTTAALFDSVIPIRRDSIPQGKTSNSTIREFYKGFKATWDDVVQEIPAKLGVLNKAVACIQDINPSTGRFLIPIVGPAGSGKTTILMQACWELSHNSNWSVYFLDSQPTSLIETLQAIEKTSPTERILVAIDNIEFSTENIRYAMSGGGLSKTIIIGAERTSSWKRRGQQTLSDFYGHIISVDEFDTNDAKAILEKLKLYGSWTRLGKLSDRERIRALLDKSKKQLLIALLEATLGRGFEEIIEDEYSEITDQEERLFLAIVSIVTDRRCEAPISLVDRALDKLSILRKSTAFASNMSGVVHRFGERLTARHPVYAKYLVERVIDPTISAEAISGLLQAFSDYRSPVIQNVTKDEATLYKGLINHKFLFESLKGHESMITGIYRNLEKKFERDGLFWLQYGLSLRDFKDNQGALEKLRIACSAYPMPHTLHALAQQLLMSAEEVNNPAIGMGLADEAKQILEKLDDIIDSDDTYPIVTLAEGYTAVLLKHMSKAEAQSSAKRFALILENRSRRHPQHSRLRVSYEKMFRFASIGHWGE